MLTRRDKGIVPEKQTDTPTFVEPEFPPHAATPQEELDDLCHQRVEQYSSAEISRWNTLATRINRVAYVLWVIAGAVIFYTRGFVATLEAFAIYAALYFVFKYIPKD